MIKVRMKHIREANLCAGGTRTWFKDHGFPWQDFLENGIPVERLEETGDPLAMRAAAAARKDKANGGK